MTVTRRPWLAAAVALSAALGLPTTPAQAAAGAGQCPGAMDIPTQAKLVAAADAVVCLVNAERTLRGVRPLQRDADLARAARGHARDMAANRYFEHTSPNGDTVGDRIRRAGYGEPGDGWRVGENLGWGTGARATPNAVVDAWLNSARHREMLLRSTFAELGVGVAEGAPKVTTSGLPGATYTLNLGVIR